MNIYRKLRFSRYGLPFAVIFTLLLSIVSGTFGSAGEGASQKLPHISSGSEIDYPPFCIVDEDGRADGFSNELLRAALKSMGREITFRTGPWAEVKAWLEHGEVQALPLVGRTPERESIFDFTFPYMSLHGAIVVRSGTTDIQDISDLRGRDVAVLKGDNAEEFLRREDRGIKIHTAATFEAALRELSQGLHDAVVIQRLVALRIIKQEGLTTALKIINRPITDFRQDFCFAVKAGDRQTLSLLNEGLAVVMADGTYRHLHAKWFAALELPANQRIVIGGDANYPPFEYLDKNGRPAGYNVDLTRAIAREMGLDIEIRLDNWAKIRVALSRGEIDAVQGMFYSAERDREFDFSPPHTVINHVAVVHREAGEPPGKFSELAGKRLVVMKGDIMDDFAAKNGLADRVTAVATQEEALRELAQGRYDCALVARIPALYWIKEHGWDNLVVGKRSLLSAEYSYAVPKNRNALLTQLSEGLKVVEETGEYRRIQNKWLGVYEQSPPSIATILRYVAMVAIPLLLLSLVFFLWSWSLRKKVTSRTKELRESETKYRLIAENTADLISILDMNLRFTYVSPSITRLLGFTVEEAVEQNIEQVLTPESVRLVRDLFEKEMLLEASGTADSFSTRLLELEEYKKDGSTVWMEVSLSFLRDNDLNPVKILTVTRDITERKQAEAGKAELESQNRQLQKAESLGRMAGAIAHHFNNQLYAVTGNLEMAMDDLPRGADISETLVEAQKAAHKAVEVSRLMLTYLGQTPGNIEPIDLSKACSKCLPLLQATIPKGIILNADFPSSGPVTRADTNQMHQILTNLVTNAWESIDDNRGTIGLTVKTFSHADIPSTERFPIDWQPQEIDYACLEVSDTGSGIANKDIEKIFDPFFTTKFTGRGLGLPVVMGIVKAHGGGVTVESEQERGSVFRIFLPVSTEELPIQHDLPAISEALPSGKAEKVSMIESGGTVLLIEDEEQVRNMAKIMLTRLGFTVIEAKDGVEAVEIFQQHRDDIRFVLSDLTMPRMDGWETMAALRKLSPDIPVILSSGYDEARVMAGEHPEQPNAFLGKPYRSKDLSETISSVLAKEPTNPLL